MFLGFGIQVKNGKPCVQPAVEECIARLKSSSAEITTLRKIQKSTLVYRLKAAVKTVHSALYDLGNIYAFCSENDWHRIVKSIHGVLKDAGLDRRTPSKILYKLTLKIPPNFMARKHLIQNALKDADLDFIRNNRYLIEKSKEGTQPFFDKFRLYFNEIDLRTRRKIIDTYHPLDKNCVEKVKDLLYSYFLKKFAPGGELSEKRIFVLSNKYKYSYEKVNERNRMFTNICICIRKVIRLAGLDSQTPREIVYALSIKLTPEQIAHKQIFQMGLKIACEKDPNEYRIGNRFRLKSYDRGKPMYVDMFCTKF